MDSLLVLLSPKDGETFGDEGVMGLLEISWLGDYFGSIVTYLLDNVVDLNKLKHSLWTLTKPPCNQDALRSFWVGEVKVLEMLTTETELNDVEHVLPPDCDFIGRLAAVYGQVWGKTENVVVTSAEVNTAKFIAFVNKQTRTQEDLGDLISKTSSKTYMELKQFTTPSMLYGYAHSKLDGDAEAIGVLRDIFKMGVSSRVRLLTALKVSFIEYNDDVFPRAGDKYVDADFERAEKRYKDNMPTDALLSAISKPAGQGTPYKTLSSENESLHHPLVNIVKSPDGLTGGIIITNHELIPRASSRTIYSRLMAENAAYDHMVRNLKQIKVDVKRLEEFNRLCLFINPDKKHLPHPMWSRATVKFVADKKSTAADKILEGVSFYTLRSESGQYKENGGDLIIKKKMPSLPMTAYGAAQSGLFMSMMSTHSGKQVLDEYVEKVTANYARAPAWHYANHHHMLMLGVGIKEGTFTDDGTVVTDEAYMSKYGAIGQISNVVSYFNEKFVKLVCRYMSINYAVRRAIAEELSYSGNVQLIAVSSLYEKSPSHDATVIAGYDLAVQVGFTVVRSDCSSGQLIEDGVFKPTTKSVYGVKVLALDHSYPENGQGGRYSRRYARSAMRIEATTSVLVDLTIPGALYIPQKEEDFVEAKEFKGKRMLIGVPDGVGCIYTLDELRKYNSFLVAASVGFFQPGLVKKDGGKLEITAAGQQQIRDLRRFFGEYDCTLLPTSIVDWVGVYLIGVKRPGGKDYSQIRAMALASVITKSKAIMHGFGEYTADPCLEYERGQQVMGNFPDVLKNLRVVDGKNIGTEHAYNDYIKMAEGRTKRIVDIIKESEADSFFENGDEADYSQADQLFAGLMADELPPAAEIRSGLNPLLTLLNA